MTLIILEASLGVTILSVYKTLYSNNSTLIRLWYILLYFTL